MDYSNRLDQLRESQTQSTRLKQATDCNSILKTLVRLAHFINNFENCISTEKL